jgi:nucleotide-binding universal stress UspA family protein
MVGSNSAANVAQLEWANSTLQAVTSTVTTNLVGGEPESALAEYVREHNIDILVMGAYGHSRIRQLLVGSTTTSVIRTTSIPLLLLR